MATFVLVHGAWHSGDMFEDLADHIRKMGHTVFCPTLAGNRPGDSKTTGLDEAITSLIDYFAENGINDAIVMGHSYGGMVITGAADRLPAGSIRHLIYWSAYVPENGQSLEDISPPEVREMHLAMKQPDGGMLISFDGWHNFVINDADVATATYWYDRLNPHPHQTMLDKIKLSRNPSEFAIPRTYIHCQQDICYPQERGGWHPGQTQKLGQFRLVSIPGSHEVCFTNPKLLAEKIAEVAEL